MIPYNNKVILFNEIRLVELEKYYPGNRGKYSKKSLIIGISTAIIAVIIYIAYYKLAYDVFTYRFTPRT